MSTTVARVDTGKVSGRRSLRFGSIDEALAEGQRMADAEMAGRVTCLGNWTAGQMLNHLGFWANSAFDGTGLKVPLPIRLMLRFMKNTAVNKALPVGKSIPKVPGGTLACEVVSTEEGLVKFKAAFMRLRDNVPPGRHPLFGKMSHAEWVGLNLRHCELHMSFVKY